MDLPAVYYCEHKQRRPGNQTKPVIELRKKPKHGGMGIKTTDYQFHSTLAKWSSLGGTCGQLQETAAHQPHPLARSHVWAGQETTAHRPHPLARRHVWAAAGDCSSSTPPSQQESCGRAGDTAHQPHPLARRHVWAGQEIQLINPTLSPGGTCGQDRRL